MIWQEIVMQDIVTVAVNISRLGTDILRDIIIQNMAPGGGLSA